MKPIPEVYSTRRSAPRVGPAPLPRWIYRGALVVGVLIAGVFCVQFVRGFIAEHHAAVAAKIAAEARAQALEERLAVITRNGGSQGVLIANIGADLAGYQLRLVPRKH